MKHKTWFRLVVKVIGLVLIAYALPHVTSLLILLGMIFIDQMFGRLSGWEDYFPYPLYYPLGFAVQFALGIYLFFGGKAIVNFCIPSNRPYCPDCGYDLSGLRGERCPECGGTLPRALTSSRVEAHSRPSEQSDVRAATSGKLDR